MKKKNYTFRSMHREREYGFFWYSAVWSVLRPVLVIVCALLIVMGVLATVGNHLYEEYVAPVNTQDTSEVVFEVTSGQSLSRVAANL